MSQTTPRILLVEDNKTNQLVAIAMLSTKGYVIDVAVDGHQAVEAVKARDYDVVLMDIQMPKMNGVDATRAIRALGGGKGSVPIIAVTANAMRGDRESYLAAGMDDYLSKPIDSATLFVTVDRWVSRKRSAVAAAGDAPQGQRRAAEG
jgi:CheY-like chemotaxis protein